MFTRIDCLLARNFSRLALVRLLRVLIRSLCYLCIGLPYGNRLNKSCRDAAVDLFLMAVELSLKIERQSSSKGKGRFKLGFLRSSKKPEMTKVGSAPSGVSRK